jgi:5'-nucleotidase
MVAAVQRTMILASLLLFSCAPVQLRIVAFNDFHGNLRPPSGEDVGGAAWFASHVDELRSGAEHAVVVSAGDLIGGSPLISALLKDEPTIAVMNRMKLDIHAMGNHELDEGLQELLRVMKAAEFSLLGANVIDQSTKRPIYPPYEIRSYGGVPVAFIGMTTEDTPNYVPPVIPELSFTDEAETTQRLIPELAAKGVRAIVVVVHEGGFQKGGPNDCDALEGPIVDIVARLPPEVDVVVSGHTHQAYNCKLSGRVVTSASCFGRMLTTIDLSLDRQSGEVLEATAKNWSVDHRLAPNAEVEAMVAEFGETTLPLEQREIGEVTAVLSRKEGPSGESPLGSVIADAHLAATKAQLAFMNSGGIRADLGTEQKKITYGMAFTTQPFNNVLVTMTLTGEQIERVLEEQWHEGRPRFLQVSQTLRYTWHSERKDGDRIDPREIFVGGEPLDPKATYRVTVNNYLSSRGVFREGTDRAQGMLDIDALEALFAASSPIAPPPAGRIQKSP